MCGIVGFVSKSRNIDLINELTHSLSHRGPDKISTEILPFGKKFLHLGSARLAVTGLLDGNMPMHDEHGNILIYNGEIYDIPKLKSDFDFDLNSMSDTRHLLYLLRNENPQSLNKINGMFAFAYFNKNEEKLVISRDKFGIKPLFFGSNNNFDFFFSSEIKTLIENKLTNQVTTEARISNYLCLGGLTKKNTLISDILTLNPGSLTEYNSSGDSKNYNFSEQSNHPSLEINNGDFKNIFCDVLDNQLEAEVPVNLLLSGGIDSTLIALFAKRYLNKDVTAFTLGYENTTYDERSNSGRVANELSIKNIQFQFPEKDNYAIIEELVNKLPEPIADPSIVPTYYLSKKVSEHTKVVISGDGADEIFGGYEWYRGALISTKLPIMSYQLLRPLKTFLNRTSSNYIPYSKMIELLTLSKKLPLETKILLWQNYMPSEEIQPQKNAYQEFLRNLELNEVNNLDNLRKVDMEGFLYTNILKKSDTASMLNGLEVRPVFLDNRIVNFSETLKFSQNVDSFKTKIFLRNILKNELPNLKLYKKKGFAHDFGNWTDEVGIKYLKNNWSENQEVANLIRHLSENNETAYFKSRHVWKFYSLFKWIDINGIRIN